jgi:lipoyl(octanoyl) transferase
MATLDGAADGAKTVAWAWLGTMPYEKALRLQERIRDRVAEDEPAETLLLLEHQPVITLGRHAKPANVLTSSEQLGREGIEVVRTSRGGDVTFHGPGQLVGYPVFRLRRGIRAHVTAMASGIVAVLAEMGIAAAWRESQPGIWVGGDKICALGVHVRRRVAIHGFALNASVDLSFFRTIVPCGLAGAGVTSIAKLIGAAPKLETLAAHVAHAFEQSFGLRMVRIPPASSRLQIASGDL